MISYKNLIVLNQNLKIKKMRFISTLVFFVCFFLTETEAVPFASSELDIELRNYLKADTQARLSSQITKLQQHLDNEKQRSAYVTWVTNYLQTIGDPINRHQVLLKSQQLLATNIDENLTKMIIARVELYKNLKMYDQGLNTLDALQAQVVAKQAANTALLNDIVLYRANLLLLQGKIKDEVLAELKVLNQDELNTEQKQLLSEIWTQYYLSLDRFEQAVEMASSGDIGLNLVLVDYLINTKRFKDLLPLIRALEQRFPRSEKQEYLKIAKLRAHFELKQLTKAKAIITALEKEVTNFSLINQKWFFKIKAQIFERSENQTLTVKSFKNYQEVSRRLEQNILDMTATRSRIKADVETARLLLQIRMAADTHKSLSQRYERARKKQKQILQGFGVMSLVVFLFLAVRLFRQRQQVAKVSHNDMLTGLYNRCALMASIKERFALSKTQGKPIAVIMLDLVSLQEINKLYGHMLGDQVIEKLAKLLQEIFVSPNMVGRFGGEEFLIILPETKLEKAIELSKTIKSTVASMNWSSLRKDLRVDLSIGAADSESARDENDLIELALAAMKNAREVDDTGETFTYHYDYQKDEEIVKV